MKILVTGRHLPVTASLREFAVKKVSKLTEYFGDLKDVHVILSVEKYRHTCELSLQALGRDLSAKKTTKDMYASVEEAVHAMGLQAAKLKDKTRSQSSRRKAGSPRSLRALVPEIEKKAEPVKRAAKKI